MHFAAGHRDEIFELNGQELTGAQLAEQVQQTMRERLTGENAPYNAVFTTNGIACTSVSFIMAALGIRDPDGISPEEEAQILDVHILLSMYNALQPGVFALSGWDLAGITALDRKSVEELTAQGDTRWINRGAHDIMGTSPDAESSSSGMPRARSLYGSLPDQLKNPRSYARRLQQILAVREEHGIATGALLDVPDVSNRGLLVMVNQLGSGQLEATVLNFSDQDISGSIQSSHLPPGAAVHDLFTGDAVGQVDDLHSFFLELPAYQGTALLLTEEDAAPEEDEGAQPGEDSP
jgi:maltose alpha-D-glucosyltransferase/alpha-amylase